MSGPESSRADQGAALVPLVRELHREIRRGVLAACRSASIEALSAPSDDAPGDTIYAIDRVSEALLADALEREAARYGGIVLVAEGLHDGKRVFPRGLSEDAARFRVLVDPIDGTRGLMYQKRAAWVLTGIAPNRGAETRLSDIVAAVQTELPTSKQHLADELWAVRGRGVQAERYDLSTGRRAPLSLEPSRASSIEHGFATVTRFFPGARDVLARLDDELVRALLGPPQAGKAQCFEDQYASTGGQLYELMAGHDRFIADLRPLLAPVLRERGEPRGLACHPYDLAAALIASELGVILTNPDGTPLDAPFDLESDVAWVGYANQALRERIEPVLQELLRRHGLGAR